MIIDLETEQNAAVQAFLVFDVQSGTNYNSKELAGLIKTLKFDIAGSLLLTKREPTAQYAIGTGKASEIAHEAKNSGADCIVFDFEINPTQQRNWEKLAQLPVYDREEIILRIFASRARTKEAVLQVELAQLQYALPRLAHTYGDMARQRGGSYGSKGSGETQLELDKRAILKKIALIKIDLEKVVLERTTQRKKREREPIPSCALVGYTNAGKSSLLNTLTGACVFVEDALFATLDATTRRLEFPGGCEILMTDTVGFIRKLPHTLVDSFRSTLEEAALANLVIIVLDASDVYFDDQYAVTMEVLREIGAGENQKLVVLNKIDAVEGNQVQRARLDAFCEEKIAQNDEGCINGILRISAKSTEGCSVLIEKITHMLTGTKKRYRLPSSRSDLESLIHRTGIVYRTVWEDDAIVVEAHTYGKTEKLLHEYEES